MADDFRIGLDAAPQSLLDMSAKSGGDNSPGNPFASWQSWADSIRAAKLGPYASAAGYAPTASGDGGGDVGFGGDGGYGGGSRGGYGGGGHDYYGDIASQPGMSDYYDPTTLMPKMDAQAAAEQGGTSLAGLAGNFFPKYVQGGTQGYTIPSDKGGFFNAQDLYRKLGRDVPGMGTSGMSAPSTNNWRLLGMGPGWIMRNGRLIDAFSSGARWGGAAGYTPNLGNTGEQSMPPQGILLGTGSSLGVPNLNQPGLNFPSGWGWPGADTWNSEGAMSRTY